MSKKDQPKSSIFNVVAFVFDGEKTAAEVLKEAKKGLEGQFIIAQAVISQDEKGKVHWKEPGRGGVGTAVGAVAGGLLGLIGGPAGLLAWTVGGGIVGGVAGKHFGRLIDPKDLKELGAALLPDTSAIFMLTEDVASEAVIDSIGEVNANVITLTVGDELSGELAQFVAAEADVTMAEEDEEVEA